MNLIGRGVRYMNRYEDEVEFSIRHGFDFMQLWYRNGDLSMGTLPHPRAQYVKDVGYPVILHAVFELADFDRWGDDLLDRSEFLGQREVIVHPVCKTVPIGPETGRILAQKAGLLARKAHARGMVLELENNSVLDGFHCTPEELHQVFDGNPLLEQLLDVAHIDSYEHLQRIIQVRYPKSLHVAGKHLNARHEHLSLTQGDLDYIRVFREYLPDFDGRIILEVVDTDQEVLASRDILLHARASRSH